MEQLPLYTTAFVQAEEGFKEWLDILGYAPITVYNMPNASREFLNWLESQAYFRLIDISAQVIHEYYQYLRSRSNIRRGGSLSNAYLNKHMIAQKIVSNLLLILSKPVLSNGFHFLYRGRSRKLYFLNSPVKSQTNLQRHMPFSSIFLR